MSTNQSQQLKMQMDSPFEGFFQNVMIRLQQNPKGFYFDRRVFRECFKGHTPEIKDGESAATGTPRVLANNGVKNHDTTDRAVSLNTNKTA